MAHGLAATAKFTKNEVVMISLYDEEGKVINDLAKKCIRYLAKTGVVGSWGIYLLNGVSRLVYHVRMDDGKVLLVTEDCLMPVKGSV